MYRGSGFGRSSFQALGFRTRLPGCSSIRVSASQYVKTRGQPKWFSRFRFTPRGPTLCKHATRAFRLV